MAATALRSDTPDGTHEAARLFEEHSDQLLGYCLRNLGSRSEAEDAVQTTFLYVLRALRRGVVPECESAWLTTIAKNVCHSQRRTLDRRGPLASDVEVDSIAVARPAGDEDGRLFGLEDALAAVPERQRRALLLREWQGLAPSEIATQLGMTGPATQALLTRARRSLAQALTLPRRPVVGVVWLIVELRSHVKALLGGISTKAAVTSIAVVGVGAGVGGIAVDRSLAEPKAPVVPVRALNEPSVQAVANARAVGAFFPSSVAPRLRSAGSRTSRPGAVSARGDVLGPSTVLTVSVPYSVNPERTPEPAENASPPVPERPVDLPVDPLQLPELGHPTQLVPPVPPVFGHCAVSPSTIEMRPVATPSSSAAIWAIAMRMPVPTSTLLV